MASSLPQVVEKPPFFMKPTDHRKVIHVNFFAASVSATSSSLAACPVTLRLCSRWRCFSFQSCTFERVLHFLG